MMHRKIDHMMQTKARHAIHSVKVTESVLKGFREMPGLTLDEVRAVDRALERVAEAHQRLADGLKRRLEL